MCDVVADWLIETTAVGACLSPDSRDRPADSVGADPGSARLARKGPLRMGFAELLRDGFRTNRPVEILVHATLRGVGRNCARPITDRGARIKKNVEQISDVDRLGNNSCG
jgi:hypothetical protein